jgi:uncharacterized protein YndB with AHSA1/START domain
MIDHVDLERVIKARPETVFSFFTDADRWLSWQGITAEIDPRPGGVFRMNVRGDGWASGRFLTVDPYRTIGFTWGWEGADSPVPPGSSIVRVTLPAVGADATLLRLRHSGLPLATLSSHREGWRHYLDRLAIRVVGGNPGPDANTAPESDRTSR